MKAKLDASERAKAEPIAVVGMSCRFPGGANSPEEFWNLLIEGRDAVGEVPADRWTADDFAALNGGEAPTCYGGFLDQVDQFDPHFFGISPREAISLDPQQRLVLEVAWEALERGGIAPDRLRNTLTGVFLGITTNDYSQLTRAASELDVYMATGGALNAAAGRVAYTLGLQGPCMAIDSACSSSLVAVHAACQSLRLREADMALAGGVNVLLTPEPFVCFTNWGMMAPDGRCKTFDAAADGFVRSEGCGVVVLKRLSDAIAAGDHVLAVVRGSAVNQDGRSSGFTVPSGLAQRAVVQQALERAGVAPADVGYVEAHGTGTSLGDPIEVEALGAALAEGRTDDRPLVLGSAKTNIGHCESASGIAGFIKTVLALQHNEIPPHLHIEERSPRIPWPDFAVEIPTAPMPWPAGYPRRIAGVSSFGFSGTNAHVVLEEAPVTESPVDGQPASGDARTAHVLTLSAKTEPALQTLAQRYGAYLQEHPEVAFADVSYTAATGRAQFKHRLSVVAANSADASEKLSEYLAGRMVAGVAWGDVPQQMPGVAMLFTGQGSQYPGMGQALFTAQPVFRDALNRCDRILTPLLGRSIVELMHGPEENETLHQTEYTQPALFAIEYALYELWRSYGVEPSIVLGHSIGEVVAAHVAGVFSLEDALRLVAARGRLMQALPQGGAMASVSAPMERVEQAVTSCSGVISIAAYNGPEDIVLSGARSAVEKVAASLEAEGASVRWLKVSHAFHSALMDPMLEAFRREAEAISYHSPWLPLVSNVTGQLAGAEVTGAAYWVEHVRSAVRFEEGMQVLWEEGCRVFVEVGPHPVLVGMGQACVDAKAGVWVGTMRRGRPDEEQVMEAVGALYVAGVEVETSALAGEGTRHRVELPTYPFQRSRYWVEERPHTPGPRRAAGAGGGLHPFLQARVDLAHTQDTFVWEGVLDLDAFPYLADHCVQNVAVVPATAYLEMALAAAAEVLGDRPVALRSVENKKMLLLREGDRARIQVVMQRDLEGSYQVQVFSRPLGAEHTGGDAWRLNASATLHLDLEHSAASVDLEDMRAHCEEEIVGGDFYRRSREKGNQWGPAFQGVERIWRRDGEAVSEVHVPSSLASTFDDYRFHPAISDACGHVLTATIPIEGLDGNNTGAFVGGGIEEVRLYKHPQGSRLFAYARLRDEEGQSDKVLIGDVHVYDETGALVSESIGARLWYLDQEERARLLERPSDWMYELEWEPQTLPMDASGEDARTWLVFADEAGAGTELVEKLASEGHHGVQVDHGDAFARLSPTRYAIRAGEKEDVRRLLDEVAAAELPPCRGIVHLWSLDLPSADATTPDTLRSALHAGCISALHVVQALYEARWSPKPRLWLATRGAQAVDGAEVAVAQAPLWGWGRTLAAEHTECWGGLIDLDPEGSASEAAAQVWDTVKGRSREDQVAFRDGQSYVLRLAKAPSEPAPPLMCREDGSYVVTGGLGGLGLQVAQRLVERGARHLILLSRTPLPDRSTWDDFAGDEAVARKVEAIRALEAAGATVHTCAVDVGDEAQLRACLDTFAQEGHPPIRGVVHAAGILQYQAMLEHDVEAMETVMRAKVFGAWLLHDLLADAPLDFFVLFSSASAVLSSPLMSSYAAANTFLDALAHYRQAQGLPALSVNWGVWREVGMTASFDQGQRASEGEGRGMGTIGPVQGLDILERLLQQPSAQVAVLPIDWAQWQKHYAAFAAAPLLEHVVHAHGGHEQPGDVRPRLTREHLATLGSDERRDALLAYVGEQVGSVLKTSPASLDPHEPLTNLGLDSLMALELKNRLEADLHLTVRMVQLLDGPNVEQLAEWIGDELGTQEPPPPESSDPASAESANGDGFGPARAEDMLADLDTLSDDQLDLLLGGLIDEDDPRN